ncbi:MAG: hypothetical protein QM762_03045 [Chryseolinea sp.]
MRLGQIARKLGVSQAEIVRYLSGQNLAIEEGSNVKLEEAHIRSLFAHFGPLENFEPKQPVQETVSSPDDKPAALTSEPATEHVETITPIIQQASIEDSSSVPVAATSEANQAVATNQTNELSDTIRAPKIELAGLKVIGKIELPQPKKKEAATSDETEKLSASEVSSSEGGEGVAQAAAVKTDGEVPEPRRGKDRFQNRDGRRSDDKRRSQNKQPREQRPYKNPIAAQREREMEEERQRQKEKAAQDKERRTQNYQKRVKHSPPTKAARLIEEPLEQMSESAMREEPTSWFGKFMKWLRS